MHGLLKILLPPFYTLQSYRKVLGTCGQDSPQTHSSAPEIGSSVRSTFIASHSCSKTLEKWWDNGTGNRYAVIFKKETEKATLFVMWHKRNIQNCLSNIFLRLAGVITQAKSSSEAITALLRPSEIYTPGSLAWTRLSCPPLLPLLSTTGKCFLQAFPPLCLLQSGKHFFSEHPVTGSRSQGNTSHG